MSRQEWNRFLNALNQIKSNESLSSRRNPDIRPYEDLAVLHTEFVEEAHGGAYFLPWHRIFIFLYESLLREVDPRITIPYWNWAIDNNQNAARSSVWDLCGSSTGSEANPQCINNGPWAGWWSNHPNTHCLRRGFTSGTNGQFPPLESWNTLLNLINSDISYQEFATTLEALHGSVHVGIGGDMTVLGSAPNDPMFFMHHAFVDLIYYRWQRNGLGNYNKFGGTHPTLNGASAQRSDMLFAFNRIARHGLRMNCVRYENSRAMDNADLPPGMRGRTAREQPAEETPVPIIFTNESGPKNVNSTAAPDEEQAKKALEVLQKLSKNS